MVNDGDQSRSGRNRFHATYLGFQSRKLRLHRLRLSLEGVEFLDGIGLGLRGRLRLQIGRWIECHSPTAHSSPHTPPGALSHAPPGALAHTRAAPALSADSTTEAATATTASAHTQRKAALRLGPDS